jgi:bacillithiol system protein YtxJ
MHWIHLTDEDQLKNILVRSQEKTQVIFKYSTRCSLSELVFERLKKNCCPEHMDFYFLDLISYRNISDQVADTFGVRHQSPQVLVIRDGECVYDASHMRIELTEIVEQGVLVQQR